MEEFSAPRRETHGDDRTKGELWARRAENPPATLAAGFRCVSGGREDTSEAHPSLMKTPNGEVPTRFCDDPPLTAVFNTTS
jgi:hypothetical protein